MPIPFNTFPQLNLHHFYMTLDLQRTALVFLFFQSTNVDPYSQFSP